MNLSSTNPQKKNPMTSEVRHGLLLVKKPSGITSHDLVDQARRVLHTKAVGHCGTLDPMASGLMVLLVGEATKLSNYVLEEDKGYKLRAKLGVVTDTLDTTGTILSEVKVDGVRLHEKARGGGVVETPMRKMNFFEFKNFSQGPDWIEFEMGCTKGSYVRAWVHEFGQKLGCGAAMSALERTVSEPYRIKDAHTLDEVAKALSESRIEDYLVPMTEALPSYKRLRVSGLDETLFGNGQISHALKSQLISIFRPDLDEGVKILSRSTGKLMGLVGLEPGKGFSIRRVFKY